MRLVVEGAYKVRDTFLHQCMFQVFVSLSLHSSLSLSLSLPLSLHSLMLRLAALPLMAALLLMDKPSATLNKRF